VRHPESILIVAGETSGDLHAAPVVKALRSALPDARFWGAGGNLMRAEGVELLAEVSDLAVMGFTGIPKILPTLSRLKASILKRVTEENTRLAILVDYPGFNLNLAGSLKKLSNPPKILQYVAPQLWAWREGRVKKIKRNVDELAVVFPFEVNFFLKHGINAHFVGHPLVEELAGYADSKPIHPTSSPYVALLPGSRRTVTATHLPIMLEAIQVLKSQSPGVQVGVGIAENLRGWNGWAEAKTASFTLWDDSRALLQQADVAAVCSGTATLEAALLGVPQVVVYKTSGLNYQIAKTFVTISNISLANLVAGRKLVAELIQDELTVDNLVTELKKLLFDEPLRQTIIAGYADVRRTLGSAKAAEGVAKIALKMLN